MGLIGAVLGGYIGSRFMGPLGAILGAAIGHSFEKRMSGGDAPRRARGATQSAKTSYQRTKENAARRNEFVFCASAAAMLAKMAKADGVVKKSEIESVERAFERLGFSELAREYAINVFRKAKDDSHTIYQYAQEFATATPSIAIRELLYELLWDVACADGEVSDSEDTILRHITRSLGIMPRWYDVFANERTTFRKSSRRSQGARQQQASSPLPDAYATLGVDPSATDAELKKAYREKAKQYHPDRLRAQGLPEGMIAKANERMAAVNAAWAEIKSARGIK